LRVFCFVGDFAPESQRNFEAVVLARDIGLKIIGAALESDSVCFIAAAVARLFGAAHKFNLINFQKGNAKPVYQ
jgi:hypothetical protein